MYLIPNKRRFYFFSTLLLLVLFVLSLVQNFIKYGHYSRYSIWDTIIYLAVLLFLFIPFLVASVSILDRIKALYSRFYWQLSIALAILTLGIFFIISNVLLHSFGFFDFYLDAVFAGYYFGREALYHLILIVAAAFYVFYLKNDTQKLQVFKGRTKLTIGLDLVHWIEAEGHYLNFHTASDCYIKRERLGTMAKQLSPKFIRIHRKFLVNRNQIVTKEKEKRDEYVVLNSGKRLKIGPSFKGKVSF